MTEETTITARYQDTEAELDTLLGEMNTAFKLVVKRLEPSWCSGTLGTFEFDAGEPISTNWIVERFGGRKFQFKILDMNNNHLTSRRVEFPEPPRKDGIELVPGPNNTPIFITEVKNEPAVPAENPMVGVLEKILAMQTAQANQMTTMLLGRVEGLEKLLTEKLSNPPQPTPSVVPAVSPDPQTQLKNTLDTVLAIEELKKAVGGSPTTGDDTINPLYNSIIEKLVDKFTEEKQAPPPQRQNPNPPPSNMQLASLVKARLKTMPQEEREMLLNHVFDDDFAEQYGEEEIEESAIAGQDEAQAVESLLTQEDREALESERDEPKTSATDAGEKV